MFSILMVSFLHLSIPNSKISTEFIDYFYHWFSLLLLLLLSFPFLFCFFLEYFGKFLL